MDEFVGCKHCGGELRFVQTALVLNQTATKILGFYYKRACSVIMMLKVIE
jgi:hypothetical protein